MRIKYTICIVFFVAIVIIEKENSIISRVSVKLMSKPTLETTAAPSVVRHTPLKFNRSFSTLSKRKRRLENYSVHQEVTTRRRKHILLFATTRTGSSFVGEFFNQHDEIFYLFEPLWHVEKKLTLSTGGINSTAVPKAYSEVLQHLYLCNFTLLEKFIEPPPVDHVTPFFFRRESSSSLCDESVCGPVIKGLFERYHCRTRRCGPLNFTMASESCRKKEHIAIKLVRVRELEILRPLADDPRLDVKIIQLVRDPRAVLASRMVAFRDRYKDWKAWASGGDARIGDEDVKKLKVYCNYIRSSAETGLSQPQWLRRRYMLMRYEDIARFPMKKAADMYRFTGIPFTPQVKAWILKNTQASKEASGIYSTQKNSSEQIEKWRFNLPFKIVQTIQSVCEPMLKLFRYKLVTSEEMLTDKSISLIDDNVFNFF